jgi:hypothetical protein
MRLSTLGTSATAGRIAPAPGEEHGIVGGMRIGRPSLSIRRKPALVPLHPSQILHDLSWDRTRAARGKRLATNCLSCGKAYISSYKISISLLV